MRVGPAARRLLHYHPWLKRRPETGRRRLDPKPELWGIEFGHSCCQASGTIYQPIYLSGGLETDPSAIPHSNILFDAQAGVSGIRRESR